MSPPHEPPGTASVAAPTHLQLFVSFNKIALSGFGGTIAWAHREIVHNRRWMSEEEFTEMLSLSQFVPGPNIANMAIYVGGRFRGATGALVAEIGLLTGPVGLLILFSILYERYGSTPLISSMLSGVTAAAMGLLIAMGVSMMKPLRRRPVDIAFVLAAFAGASLLNLSLLTIIAVLAPLSIAVAWVRRR
jgi:chromate transporter